MLKKYQPKKGTRPPLNAFCNAFVTAFHFDSLKRRHISEPSAFCKFNKNAYDGTMYVKQTTNSDAAVSPACTRFVRLLGNTL